MRRASSWAASGTRHFGTSGGACTSATVTSIGHSKKKAGRMNQQANRPWITMTTESPPHDFTNNRLNIAQKRNLCKEKKNGKPLQAKHGKIGES